MRNWRHLPRVVALIMIALRKLSDRFDRRPCSYQQWVVCDLVEDRQASRFDACCVWVEAYLGRHSFDRPLQIPRLPVERCPRLGTPGPDRPVLIALLPHRIKGFEATKDALFTHDPSCSIAKTHTQARFSDPCIGHSYDARVSKGNTQRRHMFGMV